MSRSRKLKQASPVEFLRALSVVLSPIIKKYNFSDEQLRQAFNIKQDLNMPELLSAKDAAKFLGLSPKTLANYRVHREHELPFIHQGVRVFYKIEDLLKFAEKRTWKSPSQM